MATFAELYGNALDVQLNSGDRTQLFTNARRQHEINEAEREFVRQTECLTAQSTISLSSGMVVTGSSGASEIDLSSQITDFLWLAPQPVEVRRTDSNGLITYWSREDLPRRDIPYLDRYQPEWRSASPSAPTAYYLREDGAKLYLGLTPPPEFSTAVTYTWDAIVNYVAWPSSMTSDTNVPFGGKAHLRPWHQALVHFAASRLEKLRGDEQASERQSGIFAGYIADYLRRQRKQGGSQVTYDRRYRLERLGTERRDPRVDW